MIISTEMARALLLVVLANHVEDYNSELPWDHRGCSCGWEPKDLNSKAWIFSEEDNAEEAKFPRSRSLWQEHLASVILGMKEERKVDHE